MLSEAEIQECRDGLHGALRVFGVDHSNLKATAHNLARIQTHTSGGLPFHYSDWRIKLCALNKRVLQVTQAIWEVSWAVSAPGFECPRAPFDPKTAFCYLDSLNFRLPSELVATVQVPPSNKFLQKPLRAHIDINPWDPWGGRKGVTRWRPLQGFISLTSAAGGFECAPGFHTKVLQFFEGIPRPPNHTQGFIALEDKCYEPIECYKPILERFTSVQYGPGDAVLWDWRLPHGVALVHPGPDTREVVYTSFLPEIPINRAYVSKQWCCIEKGTYPPDFVRKGGAELIDSDHVPDYHIKTFRDLSEEQRAMLGKESGKPNDDDELSRKLNQI